MDMEHEARITCPNYEKLFNANELQIQHFIYILLPCVNNNKITTNYKKITCASRKKMIKCVHKDSIAFVVAEIALKKENDAFVSKNHKQIIYKKVPIRLSDFICVTAEIIEEFFFFEKKTRINKQ